jgi:hypothetical protein
MGWLAVILWEGHGALVAEKPYMLRVDQAGVDRMVAERTSALRAPRGHGVASADDVGNISEVHLDLSVE